MKRKALEALRKMIMRIFTKSPETMDFMLDCCTEAMLSKHDKNFDDALADECAKQLKQMILNP